ncbi:hypothetical protein GLYMA_06G301400v4 [Glycine max]|uniref:Uncharacterized protein n=1 Tax=Glycine max TaxID=3847 RepID=K7KY85_SOYBN|nr:hypothetical protein GYH30_016685 [Glycine max]KRH56073.1 hypothetical protein GLYMA_06G301400v4 [Glycine max]
MPSGSLFFASRLRSFWSPVRLLIHLIIPPSFFVFIFFIPQTRTYISRHPFKEERAFLFGYLFFLGATMSLFSTFDLLQTTLTYSCLPLHVMFLRIDKPLELHR